MNFLKNLIGGQLVKGYSTSGDPLLNVGHHKQWKVYKGKKDSTGSNVSIFHIDKKQLKPAEKDQIVKHSKRQAMNLAKLRHPGVLYVIQPLVEDQNMMAFVTQAIDGNITTLLKQKKFTQGYLNTELDLKLHIFPLLETIGFLHDTVKQCHLGVSLNSIFITAEGRWKIAGMSYSQTLTDGGSDLKIVSKQQFGRFYDLLHLAPEVVNQNMFSKFSDSYSFGVLIVNLVMLLKETPQNLIVPTETPEAYQKSLSSYKGFSQFPAVLKSNQPTELIELLGQLLVQDHSYRLSTTGISNSKWMNDPIIMTVKCLEKITQYENKQQLEFLKGLAGVLDKFEHKILLKRILTGQEGLVNLLKFNHLVASILYILLDVIKRDLITVEEFRKNIWGDLRPITQGKEMTAQSLYLIVAHMELLEKFITPEEFMSCVIPLFLKCLDCSAVKLKTLALKNLERLSRKYDYQFSKTKLIPKLINVLKEEKIQVRKDALKVVHSIIKSMDSQIIVGLVLPGLENCRKAGPIDNFINAITVAIYKKITASLSADVLATKVMPAIMPYLIDPSIEKEQFQLYKEAMIKMIEKIESERKSTWSQNPNSQKEGITNYSENDFILEKHVMPPSAAESAKKSQSLTEGNKFDFLTDYSDSSKPQEKSNQIEVQPLKQVQTRNEYFKQQPQISSSLNGGGFDFTIESQNEKKESLKVAQNYGKSQEQFQIDTNQKTSAFDFDFDSFSSYNKKETENTLESSKNATSANQTPQIKVMQNESQYEPPQLDFGGDDFTSSIKSPPQGIQKRTESLASIEEKVGTDPFKINFDLNAPPKVENKQMPFSPTTVAQQPARQTSNPGSKKLVGPSKGVGGLKKPPRYNEFNIHLKAQSHQNHSNPGAASLNPLHSQIPSQRLDESENVKNYKNNTQSEVFSNKGVFGLGSSIDQEDPFAEVDKQYGISNSDSQAKSTHQSSQPASNDFDLI